MSKRDTSKPAMVILYAYALLIIMFLPLMLSGSSVAPAEETSFVVAEDTLVLFPDGAGTYHEFLDHGTGYADVDETPHDSDTTYISEATDTSKETFTFEDHTTETGTINKVRIYAVAKTSAGSHNISLMQRNGTNQVGTEQTLEDGGGYVEKYQDWETNPYTGNPWTWTAIDALEAGVRHGGTVAGSGEIRVTQVRVVVYYGEITTTTTTTTTMNTEPIATATINLLILAGFVMVPASTLFLVWSQKQKRSVDSFYLFLIVFFLGWAFIIGGVLP